jgi:hypothetical protein
VTADVPRADLVRSVMFMPPALTAGTPAWLAAAVPDALAIGLAQNPFLRGENGLGRLTGRLRPEEDFTRLSLARYQELAREINADFFVTGQVEGSVDALQLELVVYRTETLREEGRTRVSGGLLAAVDSAKPQLRKALDLKAQRAAGDVDAPVAALLSSDLEALRAMYESEKEARFEATRHGALRKVFEESLLGAASLLVFAGHWMWLRKRGKAAA